MTIKTMCSKRKWPFLKQTPVYMCLGDNDSMEINSISYSRNIISIVFAEFMTKTRTNERYQSKTFDSVSIFFDLEKSVFSLSPNIMLYFFSESVR